MKRRIPILIAAAVVALTPVAPAVAPQPARAASAQPVMLDPGDSRDPGEIFYLFIGGQLFICFAATGNCYSI